MSLENRISELEEKFKKLESNYRLILEMWGKTIKENKELKEKLNQALLNRGK